MFKKISFLLISLFLGTMVLTGCSENTPSKDNNQEDNEENLETQQRELSLTIGKNDELHILHLADLHLGDESRPYHNGQEELTYKYVEYLMENGKPDLICLAGDNIMDTGATGLNEFIEYMDSLETPWTFIFGNHDVHSLALDGVGSKKELNDILVEHSKTTDYLLYDNTYESTTESKYGNYSLKIYNDDETLRGALVFMDTGVHDGFDYEGVSEAQVVWYEEEINRLNEKYNQEEMIPTYLFIHIQTPEFYTSYLEALEDNSMFVIKQDLSESQILDIKTGGPQEDGGLFDKVVEVGSTKGIFVGHAHNFNFQVEKDGVILGFGPQTGYANDFPLNDQPRDTYFYILDKDFGLTTESIKQPIIITNLSNDLCTVGYIYDLEVILYNDTNLEIVGSDDEVATFKYENNVLSITTLDVGTYTLTFTSDNTIPVTFTLEIQPVTYYSIYTVDNTVIQNDVVSFFNALDILLSREFQNGDYIKNDRGEIVFTYNSSTSYNFLNETGLDNTLLEGLNVSSTPGQASWWGTYVTDTQLYTQESSSMFSTAAMGFFVRPTSFPTFTDGTTGYNSDPNETWNGWQASVYKAGVSAVQYVSWADQESTGNRFVFEYDLSESVMRPSENPLQPTRADIWVGNTSSGGGSRIFGVTFDAGTVEGNKDLVDGTVRNWYMFDEKLNIQGGLTQTSMGERTIHQAVATSTWNKELEVWEFDGSINIELHWYKEDVTLFHKLTVNEEVQIFNSGDNIDTTQYRLTYGLNYTPDVTTNNRVVPDLRNGGYWTNIKQVVAQRYYTDNSFRSLDFMSGRTINGGNQTGFYGCDVVSGKAVDGISVFEFKYIIK